MINGIPLLTESRSFNPGLRHVSSIWTDRQRKTISRVSLPCTTGIWRSDKKGNRAFNEYWRITKMSSEWMGSTHFYSAGENRWRASAYGLLTIKHIFKVSSVSLTKNIGFTTKITRLCYSNQPFNGVLPYPIGRLHPTVMYDDTTVGQIPIFTVAHGYHQQPGYISGCNDGCSWQSSVRLYIHRRHSHNFIGQLQGPPRKAPRGSTVAWNDRFQS